MSVSKMKENMKGMGGEYRRNKLADLCREQRNPLKTSLEAPSPLTSWLLRSVILYITLLPKDEQMCSAEPAAIDISKAALGGLLHLAI